MESGEPRGPQQAAAAAQAAAKAAAQTQTAPSAAQIAPAAAQATAKAAQPWVVLINAPVTSLAHDALLSFLESNAKPVQKIIFMGAAAAVSQVGDSYGERYVKFAAANPEVELLVCGMAAKNYGVTEDLRNPKFVLTGFMEILTLIHKAKSHNYKVVNW